MKYYTAKDSRIMYSQGKNKGIAAARNAAFKLSRGDLVAVMDSDDIMSPERLSMSVKGLIKAKCDVFYGAYLRANEHAQVLDGVNPPPKIDLDGVRTNQLPPHVTVLAKRKCFEEHPYTESFKVNDDQKLLQDWFLAGYSFAHTDEPLMIVRYHSQSTSSTRDAEVRASQEVLRRELDAI